jgi:uncharacterized membrane protein YraQ (UPF0718 family)
MNWKEEWKALAAIVFGFVAIYYLPLEWLEQQIRLPQSLGEALHLTRWYAQEHVLLCLVPAFFIAGAVGVFVSLAAVMKYLGPQANKSLAYGVASVSGTILAVCSCTILPLFAGIYRMGAGLGPASAIGLSVLTLTAPAEDDSELRDWFAASWDFAKKILPLLLFGVLIAGALLGRPGHERLIPSGWIAGLVGGNSLSANLFAAVVGAFMYFATLTEVPILQGLIGSGMGKGPALALLLAGPALSLPSMLVIRSVMGTQKTIVFVTLVIVISTAAGMLYGAFF